MKMGGKVRGLWIAFAVVGVLSAAVAQEAPPAEQPAQEPAALTPPQMVVQAKGFLPQMDRSATAVRRQLALAREQKDVVKSLCLNDKLNQIDLAIRTATDRISGLEAAAAANDLERSKHQYTVILVLKDRVTALVSEANQCIGEETGFIGESNVTVEVTDVPDTDPSEIPDFPITSNPPITSPPPVPEVPPPVSESMPES
jgi:hypothetical protein